MLKHRKNFVTLGHNYPGYRSSSGSSSISISIVDMSREGARISHIDIKNFVDSVPLSSVLSLKIYVFFIPHSFGFGS